MSDTITVYISIGNSDDKLTQANWSRFYRCVDTMIRDWADEIHGTWISPSDQEWQNACWCIALNAEDAAPLKRTLAVYAGEFRQDSIAWAEANTEFIAAAAKFPIVERNEP
jgi:hypothetical protein